MVNLILDLNIDTNRAHVSLELLDVALDDILRNIDEVFMLFNEIRVLMFSATCNSLQETAKIDSRLTF